MSPEGPAVRTLEFHILRVCERLHLSEQEFLALNYAAQLRLLAYDQLRIEETLHWNCPA